MKNLLRILLCTIAVFALSLGIVLAIRHQIEEPARKRAASARERPEPFSTTPKTTEDFVIDAFRDPERLLALDSSEESSRAPE